MNRILTFLLLALVVVSAKAVQFQAFTNANTVYVDTNGFDSGFNIGIRGIPERPFKTIAAGLSIAQAGDTLVINQGVYNITNSTGSLLKPSVNIQCLGSPFIYLIESGTGTGFGMLDDRASGATTNVIKGGIWQMTETTLLDGIVTSETRGLLTVTNANTSIIFQPDEMRVGNYNGSYVYGAYVANCRHVQITSPRLVDIYYATTIANPGGSGNLEPTSGGIVWNVGEMYVDIEEVKTSSNVLWCDKPSGAQTSSFWFTSSSLMASNTQGSSLIYISSADAVNSPAWKTWIVSKDIEWEGTSAAAVCSYRTAGRHYLQTMKLGSLKTDSLPAGIGIDDGGTTGGSIELWANVQKISTRAESLQTGVGGNLKANVIDFESVGITNAARILLTGGTANITGQTLKTTNSIGIRVTGGTNTISGFVVDTHFGTNTPVFKSGGVLQLKDMILVGPLTTNSISAGTAQNVGVLSVGGCQTNNSNVTLSPNGGFTQDTTFR